MDNQNSYSNATIPPEDISRFVASVQKELENNLLPFWRDRVQDPVRGGFVGGMSHEGQVDPLAPKGLILYARLLWTYAALYRRRREEHWLHLTHLAYDYLMEHLWDPEHQGAFWLLDCDGTLLEPEKKIYGQAFVIYALSETVLALNEAQAKQRAQSLFHLIEDRAKDPRNGGYFEVCTREWHIQKRARLSDKDVDAPKSMNNHLHVLEAYTNLYRIWPDPSVGEALRDILDLFANHIINNESGHMDHFFDEQWRPLSTDYTFGHDIEASWLLCEAVEVLHDAEWVSHVKTLSLGLAKSTLAEGIDEQGGLAYAGDLGHVTDPNREWWPMSECVVGLLNAYQLSGETRYWQAARRAWSFVESYVMDRDHGEWYWRVDKNGRPDPNEPKVSIWKGPYHNIRACLEILDRLKILSE